MNKIINTDINQIDIRLLLKEINPRQAETLCGGYFQSSLGDQDVYMNDIAEIINNAKKQVEGVDNKRSNQKINTISNSKKTYLNGVEIPRVGKTAAISL